MIRKPKPKAPLYFSSAPPKARLEEHLTITYRYPTADQESTWSLIGSYEDRMKTWRAVAEAEGFEIVEKAQ